MLHGSFHENWYLEIFWVVGFEFLLKITELKMADPIWWTRMQIIALICYKTWYSGLFEVADYESELKIYKFKMAVPIKQTKISKVTWFELIPKTHNFSESLITILNSHSRSVISKAPKNWISLKLPINFQDVQNLNFHYQQCLFTSSPQKN